LTAIETGELDVEAVERWINKSCRALLTLWDADAETFWRDSYRRESDVPESDSAFDHGLGAGKGATSNNRAFQAAVKACMSLSDDPTTSNDGATLKVLSRVVARMVEGYFVRPLDQLRGHGHNQVNAYTDSQLALSLAYALSPRIAEVCGFTPSDAAQAKVRANLLSLLSKLTTKRQAEVKQHPFLSLHRVRALDAASWSDAFTLARPLQKRVSDAISAAAARETGYAAMIEQLGMREVASPGFDPSALLSACCLHARLTGDIDAPIVRQSVDALVADQNNRGTWASAALLSLGQRRFIYLPSIETSAVLAQVALLDLSAYNLDLYRATLPALVSTFQAVRSSWARHEGAEGWRNDRNGAALEVETWTTAVVLEFLLAIRELSRMARQEEVLREFGARRQPIRDPLIWTDIERVVGSPETVGAAEQRVRTFERLDDPTSDNRIVVGIAGEVLRPVLADVHDRPTQTASFLLFGPPGTRKTSLVDAMADALEWPIITLSPPNFLSGGIEGFEARADEVFRDLRSLKRVVVLFDECEEFFRARPDSVTTESRTVGAFITAGMLPRLQRLRDLSRVVFVINSNVEAFELDDAVTRRGRLDRAARVPHPEVEAQLRYLKKWPRGQGALSERQLEWFGHVLREREDSIKTKREELDVEIEKTQREHPLRGNTYRKEMRGITERIAREIGQPVTFSSLDALAARCMPDADRPIKTRKALADNLKQELGRFGPDRFPDVALPR